MRCSWGSLAVAAGFATVLATSARAAGGPAAPPKPAPSATATGTVSGTIQDDEGKPLAGAQVRLIRKEPAGVWTATTDAKGAFNVKGVPAGDLLAVVSAKGRVAHKSELSVAANGVATVDAKLEPGVRFAGHIVDTDGKPVPGARVSAFDSTDEDRKDGFRMFRVARGEEGRTTSDAEGKFEVDGLSPRGRYRLHVVHPRYLVIDLPGLEGEAGGGHSALDVTLEPAAWASGIVVDPSGKPIAGAVVRGPQDEPESEWDRFFARVFARAFANDEKKDEKKDDAVTDARGRFSVGSLAPGESTVTASADGYFDGTAVLDSLVAGQERTDVKVVIEPATAWVDGSVVDDLGHGVAGVELVADGDQGRASKTKSDGLGHFRLEKVRSRSPVEIHATCAGHVHAEKGDVALNTNGLKLEMPRAAHVKVKVLDADGKIVKKVRVGISVAKGDQVDQAWVTKDQGDDGVDLEAGIGEVNLRVQAEGCHEARAGPMTTEAAQTVDAGTITLDRADGKKKKGDDAGGGDDGG